MTSTLEQIARQLKDSPKKVQLIYAFNGTGKTRLSQECKDLIEVESVGDILDKKFVYYNSSTEDMFYWNYSLDDEPMPRLNFHANSFLDKIFTLEGLGIEVDKYFKKLTNTRIEYDINLEKQYITFKLPEINQLLDTDGVPLLDSDGVSLSAQENIYVKVSKGEESNFIWSVFYILLRQIIVTLNNPEEEGEDFLLDDLEYVFIDDPVSSLDDNHLIELAVSLATLIKSSTFENGQGLRFIITTHNPLFYNVLYNEFNNDLIGKKSDGSEGKIYKKDQSKKYILKKYADATFELIDSGVNDRPFSYHLFLLSELRKLQSIEQVEKYHFNFLRNILEKTATFLGHKQWNELLQKLPEDDRDVMNRMLNLYSHSAHAGEEITDLTDDKKEKFIRLIKDITQKYNFADMEEDVSD